MLGFVFGTLCLVLLFASPRGRWRHRRRHRAGRPRLGAALRKLRIRPEQREPLEEALDDLRREAEALRAALSADRRSLGAAFRAETLDPIALEDLWTRASVELASRKEAMLGGLGRVHAILDPAQRERLARWLGADRRPGGEHLGAYRSWARVS